MPKMKLRMKTGEEGGNETTEEDALAPTERQHIPSVVFSPTSMSNSLECSPNACVNPARLDKETVFEWFGLHLNPAKRIEFMCGLMHMCQPLELRFLGSYLEDLARKDYHVLRDFELRANTPHELGILTDLIDPVVRSKLLVCLSLLGSDSRECAGILFRILSHVDPSLFCKKYDYSLPSFRDPQHHSLHSDMNACKQTCGVSTTEISPGPLDQLALLFSMASLHPAFHFHQRETLRTQLDKIELAIEEERRRLHRNAPTTDLPSQKVDYLPSSSLGLGECADSHAPCQSRRSRRRAIQREAVHIEAIVLKCISQTKIDKEYNFEVKWSDSSSSKVTKTHLELENFLFKLPKDQCTESFEKSLLRLLSQGHHYESRENEKSLREKFLAAPPIFRQTRKVCMFFNCESAYSTKPSSCRCIDSYSQGHKKKHGPKSQSLSSAKGPQGDSRRGPHVAELSGPSERRKRGFIPRSMPEPEQDTEKRSHAGAKTKSRVMPTDRGTQKGSSYVTNGNLPPTHLPQKKGLVAVAGYGLDTFGETSSESYSSPSSPQHRGAETLDSDEDNNKDTDSHSDDSYKVPGPGMFFTHQSDPSAVGSAMSVHPLPPNIHAPQMDLTGPENSLPFPPLSFMHPLPDVLPNGASDPPLTGPPLPSILADGKPTSGPLLMSMPTVLPVMQSQGEPDKRDVAFGVSSMGFQPGLQPLVQRFKTALPHNQGGHDGSSGSTSTPVASQSAQQAPVRPAGAAASGLALYPSSLPCTDPATLSSGLTRSLPLGEAAHAKHPGLSLPSALPSPYALQPGGAPAAIGLVASPGHVQAGAPADVPTHTPGPAPSPSPALAHSTALSDCLSYSNASASCGSGCDNPIALQQSQQQQVPPQPPAPLPPPPPPPPPQQQQHLMGCGTCGCHNNCGSRGSGNSMSGCQAPLFFPNHQMAAAVRQVFSVPPPLFQLTSLCINSYLTQGQPTHQANGAATLPPFYLSAPPPGHHSAYGHLHSHPHSHTDVPSHMLSTQVVAAAAAASYNLQQQMTPGASFQRIYQHVYPNPLGMLQAASLGAGGLNKKNGSVSCCNCGVSGHYAQECNQPSIDSTQQGGFRLKYAASHVAETLDGTD
ncbi:zinc finger CCHC domain-containing protein 2 isoform X2 [Hippocampus zosterae]|uniref:zinc finger CCHC domain-containing protein 2 isoform X2 n=1 Tax=Hippocampus zosterae TaxID=109293 RepID=UPI00223CF81E|nr:zinc finger CCHC domain-containing protein 2 isoform X2 [Hippocampus zosterae]